MPSAQTTAYERRSRFTALAAKLGDKQHGVVTRTALYAAGVTRGQLRAQLRAHRWRAIGTHCISLHTGPPSQEARWWAAVLEGGPRAMLDGVTALLAAGLRGYEVATIRVTVPRGARIRHRGTDIDIRQTRRWRADDVDTSASIPRTRVPTAAIRAALWAASDRQAMLLLTMTVQQRLATAAELAEDLLRVRCDKRLLLLHGLMHELLGGVESLNELDVVQGCRLRRLPPPDAQILRRTPAGDYYLDFRWNDFGVTVEVDGIHHAWAEHVVNDALRHNALAIDGDIVLHLPSLGLRVSPDAFFDQIRAALVSRGWEPTAAAA